MSKITIFDPNCYKFTTDMQYRWEADGHETRKTLYYDSNLAEWGDVLWFETCDNNLHQATMGLQGGVPITQMPKKKVICRAVDIEVWCGHHKNVNWDWVDDVIFIAPHIKTIAERDIDFKMYNTNVHIVRPGVDLNRFTLRKDMSNTRKIAWVAERWFAKGIDYFLQYAALLYKLDPIYKIYSVGIWADNATSGWYREYIDYFMAHNPMNVEFVEQVQDMNEFLEDKSHCICFSKKEAFSYAIAEGMAKGLKPIVHNFFGCDKIWDERYRWNLIREAIDMTLDGPYNPEEYRQYIVDNYSLDNMMNQFNNIIKEVK